MASASQSDSIEVVLVSPRNPLNIGAVARAMANFGFSRLSVVAPYEPHWREAQSAVGAESLLKNARKTATLAEAVASCTLVAGTGTLTYRRPKQPVIALPELAPMLQRELEQGGRVALIFGPEKHGLTREDLSHCHLLVEIPTSPMQPSMNLGQAAAVCLYEVAVRTLAGKAVAPQPNPTRAPGRPGEEVATAEDLDRLKEAIETSMRVAGYPKASIQAAERLSLRELLRRLHLTERDARFLLGLFHRLLGKVSRAQTPRRDTTQTDPDS